MLVTVSITVIFGLDVWLGIYYHQQEHNPLYASRKDRLPYYLRSGFWLDVLAAIPFDLLAPLIWRVARLLKIGKISMMCSCLMYDGVMCLWVIGSYVDV